MTDPVPTPASGPRSPALSRAAAAAPRKSAAVALDGGLLLLGGIKIGRLPPAKLLRKDEPGENFLSGSSNRELMIELEVS